MDNCYLVDYFLKPVPVNNTLFAAYIGTLSLILHYDLKSEIKYLDYLGGSFRCFYYLDSDSSERIYVGFNNVEV